MLEEIKNFVIVLGLFGVPSIFTLTIWCVKKCSSYSSGIKILQTAQKAQMRSQLLHQYYIYIEQGFIYSDDLDDWINQYNAYHELVGNNGVLDGRKEEIIRMRSKER